VKTNDSFVKRELLFAEGDYYDDDLLRESERNLRKHHFLDNVRIERVPVGPDEDDIYVHTEDQWTTQVDISAGTSSGYHKINVSGEESNFFRLRQNDFRGVPGQPGTHDLRSALL
jgi:outer membrane protein assembly factor BamA